MLKNKKTIYLLIPLNILIWSFFAYRIYAAFNETDALPEERKPLRSKTLELKDTIAYKLSMQYKDPFLKESRGPSVSQFQDVPAIAEKQTKKIVPVKQVTVAPKQLPEIKYLGLIRNTTNGSTTALVSLNGQSRLIKPNEAIEGVIFKSFSKDSLVARWGKERIVARK